MYLKPWYKVVTPREDLRDGRPLDASEFAVHLDHVREGEPHLTIKILFDSLSERFSPRILAPLQLELSVVFPGLRLRLLRFITSQHNSEVGKHMP